MRAAERCKEENRVIRFAYTTKCENETVNFRRMSAILLGNLRRVSCSAPFILLHYFFFPFFLFFFLGVFFVPVVGGDPTPLLATSSPSPSPSSISSSASDSTVDVVEGCLSIIVGFGLGVVLPEPFVLPLLLPFGLPDGVATAPFDGELFFDCAADLEGVD
jgi:hypothetical protein